MEIYSMRMVRKEIPNCINNSAPLSTKEYAFLLEFVLRFYSANGFWDSPWLLTSRIQEYYQMHFPKHTWVRFSHSGELALILNNEAFSDIVTILIKEVALGSEGPQWRFMLSSNGRVSDSLVEITVLGMHALTPEPFPTSNELQLFYSDFNTAGKTINCPAKTPPSIPIINHARQPTSASATSLYIPSALGIALGTQPLFAFTDFNIHRTARTIHHELVLTFNEGSLHVKRRRALTKGIETQYQRVVYARWSDNNGRWKEGNIELRHVSPAHPQKKNVHVISMVNFPGTRDTYGKVFLVQKMRRIGIVDLCGVANDTYIFRGIPHSWVWEISPFVSTPCPVIQYIS